MNRIRLLWQQMLTSVNSIRELGIVHSDLKPANFLFVQGELKLIDFGIARAIAPESTSIIRDTQMGTWNYISPEALMETGDGKGGRGIRVELNGKIERRSDVRAMCGRLDAFSIKWYTGNRRSKTSRCRRSCSPSRTTSIKSISPRSSPSFAFFSIQQSLASRRSQALSPAKPEEATGHQQSSAASLSAAARRAGDAGVPSGRVGERQHAGRRTADFADDGGSCVGGRRVRRGGLP